MLHVLVRTDLLEKHRKRFSPSAPAGLTMWMMCGRWHVRQMKKSSYTCCCLTAPLPHFNLLQLNLGHREDTLPPPPPSEVRRRRIDRDSAAASGDGVIILRVRLSWMPAAHTRKMWHHKACCSRCVNFRVFHDMNVCVSIDEHLLIRKRLRLLPAVRFTPFNQLHFFHYASSSCFFTETLQIKYIFDICIKMSALCLWCFISTVWGLSCPKWSTITLKIKD